MYKMTAFNGRYIKLISRVNKFYLEYSYWTMLCLILGAIAPTIQVIQKHFSENIPTILVYKSLHSYINKDHKMSTSQQTYVYYNAMDKSLFYSLH